MRMISTNGVFVYVGGGLDVDVLEKELREA